ncbi:MAG: NlpC/P60 family protein [Propionicimonas sp.]|nr:NlpC/P60 family protein [Propionicimonas sp.]
MGLRAWLRSTLAVAAAGVVTLSMAVPAQADPTTPPKNLKDAKAQVVELETQAAAIEEDLEEAEIALNEGKRRLKALQADIVAQQQKVDELGVQARQIALMQFQERGVDTTVQLFTDSDPDAFLDRLSTTTNVDANMNSTLQEHQSEQANLTELKRAAAAEVTALAAEEERLAGLKADMEDRIDQAEALVTRMTEEERRQLAARDGARTTFDLGELDAGEVSSRMKKVIAYAVSRVPNGQYVTGAAGPTNFDCSGLVLAAYRQIGISLPHSSRAMFGYGKSVARSDLKPGDLIFWYSPIHHVGMYIGNGKIVHARNPRNDLVIQSLSSYPAPYTGARRIVG